MDLKHNFDFSGWATRFNIKCADGRTIMKDAFKHMDGKTVPLMWGHVHDDPTRVLGHALLEHRDEGIYAYGKFNDTETGRHAKQMVAAGDVNSLSIYANNLKEQMSHVMHGNIRELSLVLAAANPGAYIDMVMAHGEDSDCEAIIYNDPDSIFLAHADESEKKKEEDSKVDDNKSIQDIIDTMTEEQQNVLYGLVGMAKNGELNNKEVEHSEGGTDFMKHNIFDKEETTQGGGVLTHDDEMAIVALAKQSGVGSLKAAMEIFAQENQDSLAHGVFEDYEELFPDYEWLKKGEPETLERDQTWIGAVLQKIRKSPISRIRTRQADARIAELRAKGYQNKGDEKTLMAQIKMINRSTDPQTIYIKDDMHRDDIIDITDFDVVAYQWKMMRHVLNEELALAALVGDGRTEGDPDKIHETHIRSVWNDEELYTIHADVDIEAARSELQGTNTSANFGENYIYAEAIITAALYAREKYKGTGTPDLYCTPHLVNVMLLARDLNGRRIYDSKSDLAAALNVGAIHTVEQFEGKTRTTESGETKKLLGLFVNMADYQFGCTKGGEITKFEDFDMDFNKYKYMLETRLSGSLTKLFSAIALEEPVTNAEG